MHGAAMMYAYTQVTESPHRPFFPNGSLPAFKQDLASFLLARGPYAWLGSGWEGCHNSNYYDGGAPYFNEFRPEGLDVDYGTPLDEYCIDLDAGSAVDIDTFGSSSSSNTMASPPCVGYEVSGAGTAAANGCYKAAANLCGGMIHSGFVLNAKYQLYSFGDRWRIGWCGHDKSLSYMATTTSALPPESAGGCGAAWNTSGPTCTSCMGVPPCPAVRRSGLGPPPLPGNVGRFRREYTKATVEMDCSVGKYGKATITMKPSAVLENGGGQRLPAGRQPSLPPPSAAENPTAGLFGVAVVENDPTTRQKLISVDTATGAVRNVTGVLPASTGVDDLSVAVDGVYYFLGDAADGTTLVGVDLQTGEVVCEASPPLREKAFVGIGQTLDYDFRADDLVLSGLAKNLSAPAGRQVVHKVLRAGLGADCGKFTVVGSFGLAAYEPAVHASSIDADGQRLFVDLALDSLGAQAIGVVDLRAGSLVQVDLEDPAHAPSDLIVGMVYDHRNKTLVGVLPRNPHDYRSGLTLHRLDPLSGQVGAFHRHSEHDRVCFVGVSHPRVCIILLLDFCCSGGRQSRCRGLDSRSSAVTTAQYRHSITTSDGSSCWAGRGGKCSWVS
jgi:hypothetical protein